MNPPVVEAPVKPAQAPPQRLLRAAPWARLVGSAAVGAVAFAALPPGYGLTLRALLGWDVAALALIVLIVAMIAGATPEHMRRRAAIQDQGRTVILVVIVGGALFSLLALAIVQKTLKSAVGGELAVALAMIGGTIMLTWILIHTIFTLHYAHGYYGPAEDEDDEDGLVGGLDFPSEPHPDYWDFMYFSFVIGMTCQVSDVQVSGRAMRRLALIHGVISFFFNTIILALTINVIASVI